MSPWDAKESLPRAYGRLFDLGNFKSNQKRILERDLASAKKAEAANLLKMLPSDSSISSSFSLSNQNNDMSNNNEMSNNNDEEEDEDDEDLTKLGVNGWISSGVYVTLLLSAISDEELNLKTDIEDESISTHPKSFQQDMNSFNQILHEHSMHPSAPMSLHALHRHENRLTVIHASIQRASTLFIPQDEVVASKETLWVVCGFRKWKARPLFSMNNLNSDKHKSERFLQGGTGHFTVASCYGPATYSPSPFLLFRETCNNNLQIDGDISSSSSMQLVGHGSIGSIDVDRIVLKRVILTGYPARVHKRTAIIKHMFEKPEDVLWFKPAPLVTKLGLEGHIQGPVGDHGLFRVHFGRALKGHDTVCLHLYKRVYPKFADIVEGKEDDDGAGALTLSVL